MSGDCAVCGAPNSPFGSRHPSDKGDYQWFCLAHRLETAPETVGPHDQINFDLGQAQLNRKEAFQKVLANNWDWTTRMIAFIRYMLPTGWEGIGEDIPPLAHKAAPEIGEPSHHNAKGGLTGQAAAKGLLRDTGRIRHMRGPKSNGRRSPIWVRTDLV